LIPLTDIDFPELELAAMPILAMLPEPLEAAAADVDGVLFALAQPAISTIAALANPLRTRALQRRVPMCI
jgi:hypothetical protein